MSSSRLSSIRKAPFKSFQFLLKWENVKGQSKNHGHFLKIFNSHVLNWDGRKWKDCPPPPTRWKLQKGWNIQDIQSHQFSFHLPITKDSKVLSQMLKSSSSINKVIKITYMYIILCVAIFPPRKSTSLVDLVNGVFPPKMCWNAFDQSWILYFFT